MLFLIYVTASELSQLLGPAEMRRLLFTYRPSELQLNRRQRARELMRLNRLADEHDVDEFRDAGSAAHHQLVEIVERLARTPTTAVKRPAFAARHGSRLELVLFGA